MEVTITTVGRNEVHAPSPLYKYRTWDKENHRTILTSRTVWMAPPSSFEDEKEFRNFKRYDLMTDIEIYNKYLGMSHDRNPGYTRLQHRAHARKMTKHAPFKNLEYLRNHQEQSFREYDRRIGVLSLTAIKDSLALWNYYANAGSGFSVGFDTITLFDYMGSGGEVVYPEDGLPIINGTDDFIVERWKQTYNKEPKWSWEQEYRVELFNAQGLTNEQRRIQLPSECFSEVIFGWNMHEENKIAIKAACRESNLSVSYFQSVLHDNIITIDPL